MPKVSVVLPTYNGSKYLAESIESVINQTFTDWELIIINDCSTDNTLEIANSYAEKDERIKVFTNPENFKLPKSLNEGFRRATGEYYTWTSDDNMYFPSAIEIMVNKIEESDELVLVYADMKIINENGDIVSSESRLPPQYIVLGNNIGACFLYTRKVSEKIGDYDHGLFLAEDYDYWIRIYKEGGFEHIAKVLYTYRIHPVSLTTTKKALVQNQTVKLYKKYFYFLYSDACKNKLGIDFLETVFSMSFGQQRKEIMDMIKTVNMKIWLYCNIKIFILFLCSLLRNIIKRILFFIFGKESAKIIYSLKQIMRK